MRAFLFRRDELDPSVSVLILELYFETRAASTNFVPSLRPKKANVLLFSLSHPPIPSPPPPTPSPPAPG
jgi:hypothetical protein